LYTAADFELDERHVIKNEKVALDRLRVRQNVFLVACKNIDVRIKIKINISKHVLYPIIKKNFLKHPPLDIVKID